MESLIQDLQQYFPQLKAEQYNTPDYFKQAMSLALQNYALSSEKTAQEFLVKPEQVQEWATGKSIPDNLSRPYILMWVAEALKKESPQH